MEFPNQASENIFRQNYEIFLTRFPKLALLSLEFDHSFTLFHTSKGSLNLRKDKETIHDESEKDHFQKALEIKEIDVLYIYGLGLGYAYYFLKEWLEADDSRDLVFLEDDPGIIVSFLRTELASRILEDRQVHIYFVDNIEENAKELSDFFPVRKVEVTALPFYLQTKKEKFEQLKLQIFRKTVLSESIFLDRLHSYVPFRNLLFNLRHFTYSFLTNSFVGAFEKVPAVVCGAGPSLEQSIETLRNLGTRAIVIAGGSTLASLSHYGIRPHFGVLIDPNLEEYHRMRSNWNFEIPLLYATRVCPEVFDMMNAKLGYIRAGIGGMGELWMDEEFHIQDRLLGASLNDESISVTTISVSLAHEFGCDPIIMTGIDMAFTGKKQYAEGVQGYKSISVKDLERKKLVENRIFQKKDRNDNEIYTSVKWLMESSCLSAFAKSHPEKTFLNATQGGIGIEGIEYMPLDEIAKKYLTKEVDFLSWIDSLIRQTQVQVTKEEVSNQIATLYTGIQKVDELTSLILSEIRDAQKDPSSIEIPYESGKMILAQMDLQEEDTYLILLSDLPQILEQFLQRKKKHPSETKEDHLKDLENKWSWFHRIVHKYLQILKSIP